MDIEVHGLMDSVPVEEAELVHPFPHSNEGELIFHFAFREVHLVTCWRFHLQKPRHLNYKATQNLTYVQNPNLNEANPYKSAPESIPKFCFFIHNTSQETSVEFRAP